MLPRTFWAILVLGSGLILGPREPRTKMGQKVSQSNLGSRGTKIQKKKNLIFGQALGPGTKIASQDFLGNLGSGGPKN